MTQDPVARIRRFNRAVTAEARVLDHSFLGRGRPLGPARVLNAIGTGRRDLGVIRSYLDLDSGLLSRLLRELEAEGLVRLTQDPADGRRRLAELTAEGAAEFAEYERLSDQHAAETLTRHPRHEKLLEAMDLVAVTLGRERIEIHRADPRDAEAIWCLEAYFGELARRFPGGFDVSLSADPEADSLRAPRGAFYVADCDGLPVACGGLKGDGSETGEVKRLWVAEAARGLGLAGRMMAEIEAEARRLGMTRLRLDTNSALPEAVALYRNAGWTEIPRFNEDPYPDVFFEKLLDAEAPASR
ncbi:GNAT family N-acetyltransferase [Roseivivax sp. GX 12232]|uniref:GNAT family N-acetyltransferase n=1 Tax=Roseivivax sp. GX 12232 TaxID=2900547 RepID=UPI001E381BF7|nr:GNAT family N-acetyltransferase [Roseivivax sp. GX 12232]MCE0507118.1 GNAT family N-acetyltransferase [Roseivivax sp. GX 12232]